MSKALSTSLFKALDAIEREVEILNMGYRRQSLMVFEGRQGLIRAIEYQKKRDELKKLRKLRQRNLIRLEKKGERLFVSLTERGASILHVNRLKRARPLPRGEHLYVIFDIPEHLSNLRKAIRRLLVSAGFEMFQKSVWRTDKDVRGDLARWTALQEHKDWLCIVHGKEQEFLDS